MTHYEQVSREVQRWLSGTSAKELSRMFDVSERTAKGWLSGNMPQNRHMIEMVELWGMAFLEEVYAPVLEREISPYTRLERMQRDIRALLKNKPIISIMIILMPVFFQVQGDDPMIRAPRPTRTRTRTTEFIDDDNHEGLASTM